MLEKPAAAISFNTFGHVSAKHTHTHTVDENAFTLEQFEETI